MVLKKSNILYLSAFVALFAILYSITFSPAPNIKKVEKAKERKYTSKEDNAKCFKCHGGRKYEMADPKDSTKMICKHMPKDYMVDSSKYYTSNHWDFNCTMCHSDKYGKTPHDPSLRAESISACLDCHAGGGDYAKYHFEYIDSSFQKSVHFKNQKGGFNCWSCHDPHTYSIHARNPNKEISEIVQYDNEMCLKCHDNDANMSYYGKKNVDLKKTHSWLPNMEAHMQKARCIDCHAESNDSTLVDHNIQPKKMALRDCAKCHSPNSVIMKSYYDGKSEKKWGFLNSTYINQMYVAGANRNHWFNLLSFIIFGGLLFGLSIHAVLRFINRKK